jgi:hypothetical protein
MSALDKVLSLAALDDAVHQAAPPEGDAAGELVKAAVAALAGTRLYLAGDDKDDDDGKGSDDHSGHPTFKALKRKGMDDGKAKSLCAQADKRVKAAAGVDAALAALSRLAVPDGDWVAATARDTWTLARGNGRGDGLFADPGYRLDGSERFPVDTPDRTRLTLLYLTQREHTAGYTPEQLAVMRRKAAAAAAEFGIRLAGEEQAAAAALAELSVLDPDQAPRPSGLDAAAESVWLLARKAARGSAGGGVAMDHAPFTGTHSHGHSKTDVHEHDHQHYGDNDHGSGPTHNMPDGPWRPGGGKRR